MRLFFFDSIVLFYVVSTLSLSIGANAAQLPGLLQVSQHNRRYFADPSGQIVYLTGAYDWNFASSMPDAEFNAYLDYVVSHGQNYLRVPSQDYAGLALQTNYLSILASRVEMAAQRGIYVQISIFPWLQEAPFDDQSFDELYARYVVQAVGGFDNVLYEVGNELLTPGMDRGSVGWFVQRIVDVINDEQSKMGFAHHPVGIGDFLGYGDYGTHPEIIHFLLNSTADFIQVGWSYASGTDWPLPDYHGQKVSIPDSDHRLPYHLDHHWVWKNFVRDHRVAIRGRRVSWHSVSLSSSSFLWTQSPISGIRRLSL